jgi:glutathione S-transferase
MPAKLYVVHGSHPCAAVARAMDMKSVPYSVVELMPPLHAALQRARFGRRTVPGVVLESGEKISGSRPILRRLDELAPSPSLFPADDAARAEVERAEEWGEEVWQPLVRRLVWQTLTLCPQAMRSFQEGSRYALPGLAVRAAAPAVSFVERRLSSTDEGAVRADLRSLPRHLDRIDGWIADGVLGSEAVNAADLQIASSTRLALTLGDVAALMAGRPAEAHARALFPDWPGATPAGVFPADWLP